jgi:hypothetical protein
MAAILGQSAQLPHFIRRGSARERFRHGFNGTLAIPLLHAARTCLLQDFMRRFKSGRHLPEHRIDPLGFNPLCQTLPHLVQ